VPDRMGRVVAPVVCTVVLGAALVLIGSSQLVHGRAAEPFPLTTHTVPTTIIVELDSGLPGAAGERRTGVGTEAKAESEAPLGTGVGLEGSGEELVYVVAQGDSLASIAAEVGVTPADLAIYNGLVPDEELHEGMVLALPSASGD